VSRNYLLTTIPTFQDAYYVSFEVKPSSTHSEWRNIIHFTAGKNTENYGDRIPAVWFIGHTTRLHICSAVNGDKKSTASSINNPDTSPMWKSTGATLGTMQPMQKSGILCTGTYLMVCSFFGYPNQFYWIKIWVFFN